MIFPLQGDILAACQPECMAAGAWTDGGGREVSWGLEPALLQHSRCLRHRNHHLCLGWDARLLTDTALGCSFQQGGVPVTGSLDSGGTKLKGILVRLPGKGHRTVMC